MEFATVHMVDDNETVVEAVVGAVATAETRDEIEIPPIHQSVDGDALNTLLDGSHDVSSVEFSYCGYRVEATPDEVRLEPLE